MKFQFDDGVLNLPSEVLHMLDRADTCALRVLLCLADGGERSREVLAEMASCTPAEVDTALAFWLGAGILRPEGSAKRKVRQRKEQLPATASAENSDGASKGSATDKAPDKKILPTPSLPNYTTEELTALLEQRKELAALIDECAQVFGKIFNTHEVSRLLALVDYLGLDGEYLLLLLAHCAKIGKKSIRYVESTALALYDDGITEISALQQRLKQREQREEAEGKIRDMFGMSSRALTTKEKKMIDAWLFEHKIDLEVIRLAYERTVDAIGKSSVPYANSIIERWASEKLLTAQDILAAEQEKEKQSSATATPGNSFNTDDFFDAALQRSFGDDYSPAGGK